MLFSTPLTLWAVDLITHSAFSFNGEPKAEAISGDDACGLPLND